MDLVIPSASLIYLFLFLRGSEEKKPRDQRVNSEDEGEEKFGKRGPQKKFKWNEEIRSDQGNTRLSQLPVICFILLVFPAHSYV